MNYFRKVWSYFQDQTRLFKRLWRMRLGPEIIEPVPLQLERRVLEPKPAPAPPEPTPLPPVSESPPEPPPPEPTPIPAPKPKPPPQSKHKLSAELRRLEKNRLKYDVWVEPKGLDKLIPKPPKPPPPPKPPKEPKPKPDPKPETCQTAEEFIFQDTKDGGQILIKEQELLGEFNFRDTILDQLDRYFHYIRRMKKHDKESYEFYRKIGITLVPLASTSMASVQFMQKPALDKEETENFNTTLTPWFLKTKPAFGCFAWGTNSHLEKLEDDATNAVNKKGQRVYHPKFMYFLKYDKPPPAIEPCSGGDIYKMTIWWDTHDCKIAKRMKGGTPDEYAVMVDGAGKIRLLKTLGYDTIMIEHRRSRINGKRGRKQHSEPTRKKVQVWSIGEHLQNWAKHHKSDPQTFLASIFADTVKHWEYAHYSTTRISVAKNDLTAAFSVDPRRLSYFFQDRDIVLDRNGRRERIFHIVRAHTRTTKSGVEYTVPFHFRGAREFDWAGYRVNILVPERDYRSWVELDPKFMDESQDDGSKKTVSMKFLADELLKIQDQRLGAWKQ